MAWQFPREAGINGLAGLSREELNIPDDADYIKTYCERTGQPGIEDWNFYMAFCFFRLASITQGIRKRAQIGTASSPRLRPRRQWWSRCRRWAPLTLIDQQAVEAACDATGKIFYVDRLGDVVATTHCKTFLSVMLRSKSSERNDRFDPAGTTERLSNTKTVQYRHLDIGNH